MQMCSCPWYPGRGEGELVPGLPPSDTKIQAAKVSDIKWHSIGIKPTHILLFCSPQLSRCRELVPLGGQNA